MPTNRILYIHGFNSSPGSAKAKLFADYLATHHADVAVEIPQVKTNPNDAIEQLCRIVDAQPQANWGFVGSSLGGYFSTYLAERYKRPAVLINPAVKPYELLVDYLGEQVNPYTKEIYQVEAQHMHDLKLLEVKQLSDKSLYYLLTQTGDEVLDYRQGVEKYQGCKQFVQDGGDHSFVDFDQMLPAVVKFLQIA